METDKKAEFVKSIWNKLGVGEDGFLSLEDLTKVCHVIGMEDNAKELFTRLDLDGDGRISFGEFLHLFKLGAVDGSGTSTNLSQEQCYNSSPNVKSKVEELKRCSRAESMLENCGSQEEEVLLAIGAGSVAPLLLPPVQSDIGSVSSICVPVWRVLKHWEQLGVTNGRCLLHGLGLPHAAHDQLVVQDLLQAVDEECSAQLTEVATRSCSVSDDHKRVLCSLLLLETKLLRGAVDSAMCERDKLRTDLAVTSHRLSSQAQELDDHTTALEATTHQHIISVEKQHQEAIRVLHEKLSQEREARDLATHAITDVNLKADHLQEQLSRTKAQLSNAEQLCEKLEFELGELNSRLETTQASLADAQALNHKYRQLNADGEPSSREEDEQWREVVAQVNKLRQDNQTLRDTNDELLARLDQLLLQQGQVCCRAFAEVSLDGSCIGNYLQSPSVKNGSTNNSLNSSIVSSSTAGNYLQCKTPNSVFSTPHNGGNHLARQLSWEHPSNSLPNPSSSSSQQRLKRSAGAANSVIRDSLEEITLSSPRDVSCANRRSSPDMLSPRAGKIARSSVASPPPSVHDTNTLDDLSASLSEGLKTRTDNTVTSNTVTQFYTCSQPASLDMHLSSLCSTSVWGSSDKSGRLVASTNSVMTTGALSYSSESVSPTTSAPHSARRVRGLGLEAELAGVRVEVANLVQQRDELASCVASLQIQLDTQMRQSCEWESQLRKLLIDLQDVEAVHFDDAAESNADNKGDTSSATSKNASASQTVSPPEPETVHSDSSLEGSAVENKNTRNETVKCSQISCESHDSVTSVNSPKEEAGATRSKAADFDSVSEVSSIYLESPRKSLSDLEPLLNSLLSVASSLQNKSKEKQRSLRSELQAIQTEKTELLEKMKQCDLDLQNARTELERTEEYWLLKLQEESDFYEEERRAYDDNFAKLEAKIKEYETEELQRAAVEANKQRLSPIDEQVFFEQQVIALEEELNQARASLAVAEAERDVALERAAATPIYTAGTHDSVNGDNSFNKFSEEILDVCDGRQNEVNSFEANYEENGNCVSPRDVAMLSPNPSGPCLDSPKQAVSSHVANSYSQLDAAHAAAAANITAVEEFYREQGALEKKLQQFSLSNFTNCTSALVPVSVVTTLLKGSHEQQRMRVQGLETELKSAHLHLQQHTVQFVQQMKRAARSDALLKQLFIENAKLMEALNVTEARQKRAEQQLLLHTIL